MQRKQPKKAKRNYAKAKKAFDAVMAAYRNFSVVSIKAVNLGANSQGVANPAKPTPIEFRCDVDKAVKLRLKGATVAQFRETYAEYDSEDSIEMEMHAQRVLGDRRHSIEQRLGAEFLRRGIYPIGGKGYFHVIR